MESVASTPVLRYGALDRAHLTKHLLQLAKRVGVNRVTMRELAAEAGTAASSVYYHVRDKRELLDLLIESVLGQIEVPKRATGNRGWSSSTWTHGRCCWTCLALRACSWSIRTPRRPPRWIAPRAASCANPVCRKKHFEAAHAALYIHLLGSVQLAHAAHPTGGGGGPSDKAFAYGLRLIIDGLLQESGTAS